MDAVRHHPNLRFDTASATALDLAPASLGGVLGWWSLFNLPRDALPGVLTEFRTALAPGGQVLIGTHAGDGELIRTEAYGGVPVSWTTYLWQADQLAQLLTDAGFQLVADVRFPAQPPSRSQVLLAAQRTA